jgi:hypothetical protein
VNNKLGSILKEVAVAYLKVLNPIYMTEGTDKNYKKPQSEHLASCSINKPNI